MILCDKCKTKEAVIHRIVITNGKKHAQHFCSECASQSGVMVFKLPTFAELADDANSTNAAFAKKCVCGHTFGQFKRTGVLGCAECYKTFESELAPVISSAQLGRSQHQNRSLKNDTHDDIASLQKKLDEAVAAEEHEEAAVLRDRIRALSRDTQEEKQ